jgi:hypothetical protein
VPCLRRLVAGLSPRRPGVDLWPVRVRFVVDSLATGTGLLPRTSIVPCQYLLFCQSSTSYVEDRSVKTGHFPKSNALLEIWKHQIYKNFDFLQASDALWHWIRKLQNGVLASAQQAIHFWRHHTCSLPPQIKGHKRVGTLMSAELEHVCWGCSAGRQVAALCHTQRLRNDLIWNKSDRLITKNKPNTTRSNVLLLCKTWTVVPLPDTVLWRLVNGRQSFKTS